MGYTLEKEGYTYRGYKLGQRVKLKEDGQEYTIIGFELDNDEDYCIAVNYESNYDNIIKEDDTVHVILDGYENYKYLWVDETSIISHKNTNKKEDMVNNPSHYTQGKYECIDVIRDNLGEEGFKAFCIGNATKYIHRHEHKNKPKEDLEKAIYYIKKAIDVIDKKCMN